MYLIRGQHNLELFNKKFPNEKLCGTIGNFDGLHLGHQAIINKIIREFNISLTKEKDFIIIVKIIYLFVSII